MNARGINRRLMRSRARTMFGKRAYLTVRFPLTVFPEPMPVINLPWANRSTNDWSGIWIDKNNDSVMWCINEIFGNHDPSPGEPHQHFIEHDELGWRWWEGIERRWEGIEQFTETPISAELVASVRERKLWTDRWCQGMDGYTGVAVLDALLDAGNSAKTTYHDPRGDWMHWTFSVKWFYPDSKRDFCATLRRAFNIAKKSGVDLRFSGA